MQTLAKTHITQPIIDAAILTCGTLTQDAKKMCIGYMIANTNLQIKQIGAPFQLTNIQYIYEVLFQDHRHKRENDKDYRAKYYELCERLGTKNRL